MTTTVSSILKFLENADKNFAMDTDADIPKSKKRKLDHLTWEEKLQRKKLKNRVAAQTSRDRKKAKMEQMEQALQQLFVKNESLLVECKNLKLANQKLQQENTELYNRLQAPCLSCAQAQNRSVGCESLNGSTASLLLPKGRVTHPAAALSKQQTMVLLKIVLTCLLYRILDELEADVDLNSLEQLTQSLLEDIARDLEATAQKTSNEESGSNGSSYGEMVGKTSTELESSGCTTNTKSLESDISEYLLLHHNYAAKPPLDDTLKTKSPINRNRKLKTIKPKRKIVTTKPVVPESDVVYGTLDEVSNVVTIIVDSNGVPMTEEALQRLENREEETQLTVPLPPVTQGELVTPLPVAESNRSTSSSVAESHLTVPTAMLECLSPMSCSDSDRGYESLDSPISLPEDLWDQSISELFPSLL
uniref:X-box-binding protein 1 n=1 Tax=Diabrotica virgifera virgifera TaxID=50390 RepID=A0A6P7GJS1_DIAVI